MKEDLEYVDIDTLTKIKMWYYNIIGKIGKRLQFRQQVVATAIVYFKRFYTKNSIRSTDPSLVAATCIYLACKIEECPQHIKHIIQEMKHALVNLGGFDYDTSKVAEFEFYLLEELEFYLIVYHPYRDLTLIAKDLKLEESNLQTAWFVLNDSYRTDIIEITQEILSLYSIWKDYNEEHVPAMIQALKMPSEPTTPQNQMM
ncbi:RNA polymerase II holoenzyme cyclin-like subunit [Mortierella sp. GBA35]|nr:RNA polymerase II holoenzyme cyclin-like subunit [Mortierella sp. GBA35]